MLYSEPVDPLEWIVGTRCSSTITWLDINAQARHREDEANGFLHVSSNDANCKIDTKAHTVSTSKGRILSYDYCVLATASEASLPGYVDRTVQGVFVYRNIADLNSLLKYSERADIRGTPVSRNTMSQQSNAQPRIW